MTVTAKNARKVLTGEGWSNPLEHDVYIESSSHVEVWADDVQLALGDDYTVSGVGDPAGYEVTILSPSSYDDVEKWVLIHNPPLTQGADLSAGGAFGLAFENALDAISRRLQAVDERASRSLKRARYSADDEDFFGVVPIGLEDGTFEPGPTADEISAAEANAEAAAASATAAATSATDAATAKTAAEAAQAAAAASAASLTPTKFNTQAAAAAATIASTYDYIEVAGVIHQRITTAHPRLLTENITNGAFVADTNWTKGANWSIAAGVATKTAGAANHLSQSAAWIVAGRSYLVSYSVTAHTASGTLPYFSGGTQVSGPSASAVGSYQAVLTALSDNNTFNMFGPSAMALSIDNVSVKQLPTDAFQSADGAWWARPTERSVTVSSFDTIANLRPAVAYTYIKTLHYAAIGGGGGAWYKFVASEPSHAGKASHLLADGVTTAWYELIGDDGGRVTPEMFGATRGKGTLSTTALSNLTTFVNATGMPIRLDYFYRTAATMTFTVDGVTIEGTTAHTSGIFFEGCNGIVLDHDGLTTFARFKFRNFALLTDSASLYRAIDGIGVASTGGARSCREISNCLFVGEGVFETNDGLTAGDTLAYRASGWLDAIRLEEMDNTIIRDCRIFGSWQQFMYNNSVSAIKFEIDAAGVRLIGCTGTTVENTKVFYTRHGAHVSGQCEGVNLIRNIFFPCWNGITFIDLVAASNYHQIVGNHVSAFNRGISFAEDQTGHASIMNRFSDNLIFMYPGNTYASYDFRHIVISCSRSEIRSNYFYIAASDVAATYCPTAMEIQSSANQITHNQFDGINVFITFGASGQNSLVAFNQSFASEGVGSVDPVVDGGANNVYAFNMGDKAAQWDTKPWFGTRTSNADAAINGYVQIRDAGGMIRKLATIA